MPLALVESMSALGLAIPINPTVKNTTINKQLTQQYDMYVYIYNTYMYVTSAL